MAIKSLKAETIRPYNKSLQRTPNGIAESKCSGSSF